VYCEGDERAWAETLLGLIREASDRPDRWAMRRSNALERARVFSWQRYADTMTGIYQELGRERPDKIEPTRSHS
jgi:hypothetical protein